MENIQKNLVLEAIRTHRSRWQEIVLTCKRELMLIPGHLLHTIFHKERGALQDIIKSFISLFLFNNKYEFSTGYCVEIIQLNSFNLYHDSPAPVNGGTINNVWKQDILFYGYSNCVVHLYLLKQHISNVRYCHGQFPKILIAIAELFTSNL